MHFTVRLRIPESQTELLEALIDETPHIGIEIRDHSLKPLPGAEALAPGRSEFTAWYESEEAARSLIDTVKDEMSDADIALVPIEDQDWTEGWKRDVRSTRAGRIWVGPPWLLNETEALPGCIPIVIEPGMAFGTGDHPTTAMCLEAIDAWVPLHPGCTVLDVGTGSGVLVMAARKLGSGQAMANDIDPQAVDIARDNAAQNGVDGIEWTTKPLERIRGSFELVLANIFANVLCHLAPRLSAATSKTGRLLLTGILDEQVDEVKTAFEREGMRLVHRRDQGEWALLEMAHFLETAHQTDAS
ncbi:MAG: 50S ribosomal protein L11 methyltransferase [Myxococcales bacterium]|jgi:ribosomal protein L11 methyltransferase|nr:50S ribosomal protein L11 methyltransferase [Myxococcales bacterium]